MSIVENLNARIEEKAGKRYVVISPVKNEAEFIEGTIRSMICQTIRPVTWVIVNDGSRDTTEAIVRKYAEDNAWIKLINRPGNADRKRGKGVVDAFYAGYDTLVEDWDFVVKLDGDVSFDPNYFESLLREFASDPLLGIAGGALYEKVDGKNWLLNTVEDHVRGATKMYRRACFTAIDGLTPSMGWDGIDEWKALFGGWKVRSFLNLKFMHYRYTGAATGFLKSFYEQGYGAYRMGYHPLYITARSLRRMSDRPYFIGGLAMLWAYFVAWLHREEMLASHDVVRFIRRTQLLKLGEMLNRGTLHK